MVQVAGVEEGVVAARPRALIVDADATVLSCLAGALDARGYAVDRRDDATTTTLGTGTNPVLAIVDTGFPNGRAYQVVEELRTAVPNVRIVVTTSRRNAATEDRALAAGADVLLDKPYGLADLLRLALDDG